MLALCMLLGAQSAHAQADGKLPDYYKEPGMYPTRDYVNQHFGEQIDPFTGSLQHQYTDVYLPGNGGLDIKVQRAYNSNSVNEAAPANGMTMGVGWTMHFGRVYGSTPDLCANTYSQVSTNNPVLELPDGSTQQLFFDSSTSTLMLSNRYWYGQCSTGSTPGFLIISPDGTKYTMRKKVVQGSVTSWFTTFIEDRNGNTMSIGYGSSTVCPDISLITTSDSRRIDFSVTDSDKLYCRISSVIAPSGTWSYTYNQIFGRPNVYQLSRVTRPESGIWDYSYNTQNSNPTAGSFKMFSVDVPQGGRISYSYNEFQMGGQSGAKSNRISGKTADGQNWTYSYSRPSPSSSSNGLATFEDATTITTPSGTMTYRHAGPSSVSSGDAWKIGFITQKKLGADHTEDYEWGRVYVTGQRYARVGEFGTTVDQAVYQPVLLRKIVTRGAGTYITTYSGHDTYGNPGAMAESGPNSGTRSTAFTYFKDVSKWLLVGFVANEARTGGANVTRGYDANGNVTNVTRDGVGTGYTYNTGGTVASTTNARNNSTTFGSYKLGIAQTESRPASVSVTRAVSDAGNIVSETVGGQSFSYSYDGLNRIKSITYPAGGAVGVVYTPTSKTATRGALVETTKYNAYGYLIEKTVGGITRAYGADALGRKTFESNPGSATSATVYAYDILDRVNRITHPDGTSRSIGYNGNTDTLVDERGVTFRRAYRSYGDPSARFLIGIDAPEQGTAIERNDRDLITKVTQGNKVRSYSYNSNYYVNSITEPETGTTSFGRDGNGNMTARSVGNSGQTSYAYDGLDRLIQADYPSASAVTGGVSAPAFSVTKSYNARGKVLGVGSSAALGGDRSYSYDGNDNLTSESLVVDNKTFTASYGYNNLDQLAIIAYPQTNRTVDYAPNALGRPTKVGTYATSISFHDSGQVNGLTYGNNTGQTYAQNAARLWPSSFVAARGSGGGTIIGSSYTYDGSGNVTAIADSADSNLYSRSSLTYDGIHRLKSVSGPWGSGNFSYDDAGNLTSRSDGGSTNLNYDSNNRLASLSGARSNTFSYDPYGNIAGDGANTYQYDGVPNLVCANCSTANQKIEYGYDGTNMRVIKKQTNGPGATTPTTTTYEFYAASGQLLLEYTPSENNQTVEHIYLGDKRIAQRTSNTRPTSGTGAITCAFDINQDGALDPNIDGLLITRYAQGFRGNALIAGITTSPALDANAVQARLQALTTAPNSGTTATLDIDGDGKTLASTDAQIILRKLRRLSGPALITKVVNQSASNNGPNARKTLDAITNYIESICPSDLYANGDTITYFHNDIAGSPQAATDASGNVLWKESYKAYGERVNTANNAAATETGKGKNDVFFHGKRVDELNGGVTLSYFGARYFNSVTGRFMGVDPKGFSESNIHSFNRYAFANNNPYRFTDPDGMEVADLFPEGAPIVALGRGLAALATYTEGVISKF